MGRGDWARRERIGRCIGWSGRAASASLARRQWERRWPGATASRTCPIRPDLAFECCDWIGNKKSATICSDTWGIEVRPNEISELGQPLQRVTIRAWA